MLLVTPEYLQKININVKKQENCNMSQKAIYGINKSKYSLC
jgi:hypothetical protein